ncbi:MAG: hypothetical protein ACKVWV_06075 [Planctomycetota bacterium]
MSKLETGCLSLVLALFADGASAQCAEWSSGFGQPGLDGEVFLLQAADDGSGPALFAAGKFSLDGVAAAVHVARWDGARWSAFAVDPGSRVQALTTFDDGSGPALYASDDVGHVLRWNGASWSALGAKFNRPVLAMTVFDDGSGSALYAAGSFMSAGGQTIRRIARWDGVGWKPLGAGIAGTQSSILVRTLAVYDDGSGLALYVGGKFSQAGEVLANNVAKWDGASWHALGAGVTGTNASVAQLSAPAALTGSPSELYAVGQFTSAGGVAVNGIARWDGHAWAALGSGPEGMPLTMTWFDDGHGEALYASGYFSGAVGAAVNTVAKWDGSGWTNVRSEIAWGMVWSIASFDDGHGARLFAGGLLRELGGARVAGVAVWNGAQWSATVPTSGLDSYVYALATFDDGEGPELFASGQFAMAGGVHVDGVAKWNGKRWARVGDFENTALTSFAVFDDGTGPALYASGSRHDPSQPYISWPYVAYWEDSIWWEISANLGGGGAASLAVFDDGAGPALYAAGWHCLAGSTQPVAVARWTGSTWSPVGDLVDGASSLAVFDDGTGPALYAGGYSMSIGGAGVSYIARWDGTRWSDVGGGVDGGVAALAVFEDAQGPALIAAGIFLHAGGERARSIARWDGTRWSALGSGVAPAVSNLCVFDDGSGHGDALYAGGWFDHAGGVAAHGIARWNGAEWSALGFGIAPSPEGLRAQVNAMAVFDDGAGSGAALFVGSAFYQTLGEPEEIGADMSLHAGSRYLARWSGCGDTGALVCFGDGASGACPCGNASGTDARAGCTSSLRVGATLRASGAASVAHDELVLRGADMPPSSIALYFQGTASGVTGTALGDGLMCVSGSLVRLGVQACAGGVSRFPEAGGVRVSVAGAITAPGTRFYQACYRDAAEFCTPARVNLSNALRIRWDP